MEWIVIVVAAVAALVTFVVGAQALASFSSLSCPRLIAAAVAALAFITIFNLGERWASIILIPYAALGLILLGMCGFFAFRRSRGSRSRPSSDAWKE